MTTIVTGTRVDISRLRGLWLELHHHHLRIATYPTPTDDEQSWQVRRRDYQAALDTNTGFPLLATHEADVLGYAMVLLHPGGPNDTFVLGPTYAELYTLIVAAEHRSAGIGTALFGAVESELTRRSITELEIAVMANNLDAQTFYLRRGARPVETMLWKFAVGHHGSDEPVEAEPTGLVIEPHDGPRAELKELFALAEDSDEQLANYQDQGDVLVARVDNIIVGHLQHLVSTDRSTIEIKNMAVDPDHQRRGIGTALIDALRERAIGDGYQRLTVATATADIDNLRFYQRNGFRCTHIERDAFVPATGYPTPIVIDGIALRDRVWLDAELPQHNPPIDPPAVMPPHPSVTLDGGLQDGFERVDEGDLATVAFLHDRIYEHNVAVTGIDDGHTFTFVQRNHHGRIVAGATGWTWGRSAWLDVLWVATEQRSNGTGTALLRLVETEARTRDCAQLALATHTFQARGFYEAHGFTIEAYLDQHPAGHGQYVMRKWLRQHE